MNQELRKTAESKGFRLLFNPVEKLEERPWNRGHAFGLEPLAGGKTIYFNHRQMVRDFLHKQPVPKDAS